MADRSNLRRWEPLEDALIRTHYPDYGLLQRTLPDRTFRAVKVRAYRLGVARQRHVWTNKDRAKLNTDAFACAKRSQLSQMFPGFRTRQVLSMASHLKIKRKPSRPIIMNCACLDSIRERAWQKDWSFVRLDREAGSGKYFSKSVRKIRVRPVYQAIKALGGRVTIEWDDLY